MATNIKSIRAELAVHRLRIAILKAFSRWPAGAPAGKGGQFAPKNSQGMGGGSASSPQPSSDTKTNATFLSTSSYVSKPKPKIVAPQFGIGGFKNTTWMFGGKPKPKVHPPGAKTHPQKDDKGREMIIDYPSIASKPHTWSDHKKTATFTPFSETPDVLNNIKFRSWTPPEKGWNGVSGTKPGIDEANPFVPTKGKSTGAGVIIMEPDGRIWLTEPTNNYGNYDFTFPKGTAETGLTLQENAIKEAWEETGLKVKITGLIGDVERTTSRARFYLAVRESGTPKDMGFESQSVALTPMSNALQLLDHGFDRRLIEDLQELMAFGKAKAAPISGAWTLQPRWPAGSALGGQWKASDADGLTMPITLAGGLSGKNPAYQKKIDAAYAAAKKGDLSTLQKIISDAAAANAKFALGIKSSSHVKWGAGVFQYAIQLQGDINNKTKANATAYGISGPEKLSDWTKTGGKPGGSNPGGMYKAPNGAVYLVKGSNASDGTPRAQNEVLASKLMQAAGVGVPDMKLVDLGDKHGGGLGVASLWMEGGEALDKNNPAHIAAARADFAVHAWLANYDVIGLTNDNTKIYGGQAVNIDPGGALLYRAQGKEKGEDFGIYVTEFDSLRDPKINAQSASVYGGMTNAELAESIEKVLSVDNQMIKDLVNKYGPGSDDDKAKLINKLRSRKDHLALIHTTLNPSGGIGSGAKPSTPLPTADTSQAESNTDAKNVEKYKDLLNAYVKAASNELINKDDPTVNPLAKPAKWQIAEAQKFLNVWMNDANQSVKAKALDELIPQLVNEVNTSGYKNVLNLDAVSKMSMTEVDNTLKNINAYIGSLQHKVANVMFALKAKLALGRGASNSATTSTDAQDSKTSFTPAPIDVPDFNSGFKDADEFYADLANKISDIYGKPLASPNDCIKAKYAILDLLIKKNGKTKHSADFAMATVKNLKFPPTTSNGSKMIEFTESVILSLEKIESHFIDKEVNNAQASIKDPAPSPISPPPALPSFGSFLIDPSNTNASSHNPKIALIETHAKNKDIAALLSMPFGTNTYAKKQVKLVNAVLSALGSTATVKPGQKAGENQSLYGGHSSDAVAGASVTVGGGQVTDLKPNGKQDPNALDMSNSLKLVWTPYTASSKSWKNDANNAVLQKIETLFNAGNFNALRAATFEVLDDNGNGTGVFKGIGEHPAKPIASLYSHAISEMHEILYPPPPLKPLDVTQATTVEQVSAQFKPKKLGTTVKQVPKNEQVGFWVALGKAVNFQMMVPKVSQQRNMTAAAVAAGVQKYQTASSLVRWMLGRIQSSSSFNEAFRNGDSTFMGKDLRKVAQEAYDYATEQPEGTTIYRYQNMSTAMVKELVKAGPGTVIQATGPMCASYHETANSGFGSHKIKIIYAKGAKALDTHGTGGYASEREITTLMNQRFIMNKIEVNNATGRAYIELLMLPPDPGL